MSTQATVDSRAMESLARISPEKAAGNSLEALRGTLMSINSINNIGSASPVQKVVSNPIQKEIPANAPAQLPATDRLELSGVSHLLQSLKSNDIRGDKVATIKSQIAAGTYDDEHKLNVAVDRLLDDLTK